MFMPICATIGLSPTLAQAPVLGPMLIMALCAVAGVGTYVLLPSKREGASRKIGGAIALLALAIFGAVLFRYSAGAVKVDDPKVSPYFWVFAAITVIGALRVITHPRPVYSALYFVLTVFSSAGLFILLNAEFMAAALVLIYAGAILVTYVFVIMLAQQSSGTGDDASAGLAEYDTLAREPVAATLIGFVLMGILLFVIFDRAPGTAAPIQPYGQVTTRQLGESLFSQNLLAVEVAGVILTLAMVGAIAIARRRVPAEPGEQPPAPPTSAGIDDNPHSIPIYGTDNPRQKAYPET